MTQDKCGIYEIRCVVSKKRYVGSSYKISNRWRQHLYGLRKGIHKSPRLQQAWLKHGESNFIFTVLEECAREDLFTREQFHIDREKCDYNSMPKVRVITDEMRTKMLNGTRRFKAAITHCPHGHEYTPENTYIGRVKGERRCKQCNAERVARIYVNETAEQRELRLSKMNERYQQNYEEMRAKQNEYAARTREQKREYDRAHLAEKRARRATARAEGRAYG